MISRYNILFLSLFISSLWAAPGDEKLFDQATVLYKKGLFDPALVMYSKIVDKDRNVFFNQGNCAFKLQDYGYALVFWRRAERDWGMWESRQELNENIALVKKITTPTPQKKAAGPWGALQLHARTVKESYLSFVRATPLLFFQLLLLFFWLLSFVLLRWLKHHRRGAFIVLIACIYASVGMLMVSKSSSTHTTYGVVTSKKANLYSGPGESYQILATLPQAQEVIVQRQSDDFYKIKASPFFGWIHKDHIGII